MISVSNFTFCRLSHVQLNLFKVPKQAAAGMLTSTNLPNFHGQSCQSLPCIRLFTYTFLKVALKDSLSPISERRAHFSRDMSERQEASSLSKRQAQAHLIVERWLRQLTARRPLLPFSQLPYHLFISSLDFHIFPCPLFIPPLWTISSLPYPHFIFSHGPHGPKGFCMLYVDE